MEREEDNDALPIPPAAFEFIQAAEEHLFVIPKVPQVSPLANDEVRWTRLCSALDVIVPRSFDALCSIRHSSDFLESSCHAGR